MDGVPGWVLCGEALGARALKDEYYDGNRNGAMGGGDGAGLRDVRGGGWGWGRVAVFGSSRVLFWRLFFAFLAALRGGTLLHRFFELTLARWT